MTTYIVEVKNSHGVWCLNDAWGSKAGAEGSATSLGRDYPTRIVAVESDAGTAKIIAEFAPEKWEKRWLNIYASGEFYKHADHEAALRIAKDEACKTIPIEIDFARGKIRQVEE